MQNEKDLAARVLVKARAGKGVRLTPDTAYFVGLKLMTASEKPTLPEIVAVLCDSKYSARAIPVQGEHYGAYPHHVRHPRGMVCPVRQLLHLRPHPPPRSLGPPASLCQGRIKSLEHKLICNKCRNRQFNGF